MRKTTVFITCVLLTACTSSLRPVQMELSKSGAAQTVLVQERRPDGCSGSRPTKPREELAWYSCALTVRAETNLTQSLNWANRTEWRDIPLIGAAATVVGLLLFGERNAEGVLESGAQEAVEITAFGAATFSAFANYLSPQTARKLLRQGARGHRCMAAQGSVILSLWDGVVAKETMRNTLSANLSPLAAMIATADPNTPGLSRYVEARDAGNRAVALFDHQLNQLNVSPTYLGEAAWNFGIDLIEAADRQPVDVSALVESISQQATSIARFEVATDGSGPEVPAAAAPRGPGAAPEPLTIEDRARQVVQDTARLLAGLPNVEALVLGFDRCASTALADGNPTVTRIQRAGLD